MSFSILEPSFGNPWGVWKEGESEAPSRIRPHWKNGTQSNSPLLETENLQCHQRASTRTPFSWNVSDTFYVVTKCRVEIRFQLYERRRPMVLTVAIGWYFYVPQWERSIAKHNWVAGTSHTFSTRCISSAINIIPRRPLESTHQSGHFSHTIWISWERLGVWKLSWWCKSSWRRKGAFQNELYATVGSGPLCATSRTNWKRNSWNCLSERHNCFSIETGWERKEHMSCNDAVWPKKWLWGGVWSLVGTMTHDSMRIISKDGNNWFFGGTNHH